MLGGVSGRQAEFRFGKELPSIDGPNSSIFSVFFERMFNMLIGSRAIDWAEMFRTCSPRKLFDQTENGTLNMVIDILLDY